MENERKKKFVQVMKCTAKMLEIIIFFFYKTKQTSFESHIFPAAHG